VSHKLEANERKVGPLALAWSST